MVDLPSPDASAPKKQPIIDILVGINPRLVGDKVEYEKIGTLAQGGVSYLLIFAKEKLVENRPGVTTVEVNLSHNIPDYETLKHVFAAHYNFMERVELQHKKEQGSKVIIPGSKEFNLARRNIRRPGWRK